MTDWDTERARAEKEGAYWDRKNDWLAEQDAKRTPEEREARRALQAAMQKMRAKQDADSRIAANQKRIREARGRLFWTVLWLVICSAGTFLIGRHGATTYDPNASIGWGGFGLIVLFCALGFVSFVLAFVSIAAFFGLLRSLFSRG